MADLIDRIAGIGSDRPKIPINEFLGCFLGYVTGIISATEIVAAFDLQGDELTQAMALKNNVDAETTLAGKLAQVAAVEAVAYLIEQNGDAIYHIVGGQVDKVRVKNDLGW